MEKENKGSGELKHLGFLRAAALTSLVWLSSLYDYVKHKSGPLKPAVEGAVNSTVAPLFHKFKSLPPQLLSFLDQKVDEASVKFEEHAPAVAKQVAGGVQSMMMKAAQTGHELLRQAQIGGPSAATRYAASESKEFAVAQTVFVWTKLDRLPPFHAVAEMAVPTAAHWSDKYNRMVTDLNRKGYTAFGYLPLVPVDDIAKAFKQAESKDVAVE
ncbi:hypothetical protein V2J09_013205 [Rumex salicifolius]